MKTKSPTESITQHHQPEAWSGVTVSHPWTYAEAEARKSTAKKRKDKTAATKRQNRPSKVPSRLSQMPPKPQCKKYVQYIKHDTLRSCQWSIPAVDRIPIIIIINSKSSSDQWR
ncbi:hypothetical protein VTJ04DRAFT_5303 [Mycothermus thermophilus]|uniref:uncharacterized protein n=1 Tax=Humicola insolens TaxID=85995 RepID=UPI0037447B90